MEAEKKGLLELAMGAIAERIDLEVPKIIDNIQDLNTKAEKKRTLTITVDFMPDAKREHITMNTVVKSKIEPTNAIQTSLAVGYDRSTGEQIVVELVPSLPGQLGMDGSEQAPPAQLRLVR